MSYQKATLSASTKEAIETDIKSLTWNGVHVYPDWPQGYERSFGTRDRFVVTEPRQEVIEPAIYDENGNEVTPSVLGDWKCKLVLPEGYPIESLQTLQPE